MMIELVMYGMMPSANRLNWVRARAGEQLEEGEHPALPGLVLDGVDRVLVDAGNRDVGAEPVQDQHEQA